MTGQALIGSVNEVSKHGNIPKNLYTGPLEEEEFGIFFFKNTGFQKEHNHLEAAITLNSDLVQISTVKNNEINRVLSISKKNNTTKFQNECAFDNLTVSELNCDSDINLKENISIISNALDNIDKINPVKYSFIKDKNKKMKFGVIAQEIKEILPDLVSSNDNGKLSVDYNSLIGLLIKGMKEQQKQIETLKKELDDIKNNI